MANKYKLVNKIQSSKINGTIKEYVHLQTNCRIVCIENEDENKSMSISFKTIPSSLSGIAHILEHTVFCGSKKYNIKDPFNSLYKYNIASYINACTCESYTYFSFTTINKFSFDQIKDVYLDTVFNPNIFSNKYSFMQEGIRFEIAKKEDEITPKGIVYSEMQGQINDINYFIEDKVKKTILNKTFYKYDNFGEPFYILDAKYEDILDFYLKYYHPSNALIILYGNLNYKDELGFLDSNYLSKYSKKEYDFKYINQVEHKNLKIHKIKYPSNSTKGKYYVYSKLVPADFSTLELLALQVISEVLFNYSTSYFEKVIVNNYGIASKIEADVYMLKDSFFMLQLDNVNKEYDIDKINNILKENIQSIIDFGLPLKEIKSYLKAKIFEQSEVNINSQNYSQYLIEEMLDSYYNIDDLYYVFNKVKYYKELLSRTNSNYFDNLFKNFFSSFLLQGDVFLFSPSKKYMENENKLIDLKLKKYKQELINNNKLDDLINDNIEFENYLKEDVNDSCLQSVSLVQIDKLPQINYPSIEKINDKNDIFYFYKNTNNIIYGTYRYDISTIDNNQLDLLILLDELYFELPTKKHTLKQLSDNINKLPCSVSTFINALIDKDGKYKCYFEINFKCYKKDLIKVNNIIKESIFTTKFDDLELIKKLICKHYYNLDQRIDSQQEVITRVCGLANIDKSFRTNNQYLGIKRRNYLYNLMVNYSNTDLIALLGELDQVIKNNFNKDSLSFSYTASKDYYVEFKNVCLDFFNNSYESSNINENNFFNIETKKSIGYIAPIFTNYLSYVGIIDGNSFLDGRLLLLSNIINSNYLYPKIRIELGGYSTAFNFVNRDKFSIDAFCIDDINKTIYTIKQIPEFIDNMNYSLKEFESFKVSTLSLYYKSIRYSEYNDDGFTNYVIGIDDKIIKQKIDSIKTCSLDKLKDYSKIVQKGIENGYITCIGNKKDITKSEDYFNIIKDIEDKKD